MGINKVSKEVTEIECALDKYLEHLSIETQKNIDSDTDAKNLAPLKQLAIKINIYLKTPTKVLLVEIVDLLKDFRNRNDSARTLKNLFPLKWLQNPPKPRNSGKICP